MLYYDIYHLLKGAFKGSRNTVAVPELGITFNRYAFTSEDAALLLPGSALLYCQKHGHSFEVTEFDSRKSNFSVLESSDHQVKENNRFTYTIVSKTGSEASKGAIILLHGLNEKNWDKYLPWAYRLVRDTGKAVILFPIAFHMDRAPESWSDRHLMLQVAWQREQLSRDNTQTSYVNAAISSRMDSNPQRLFWSGMQTYGDILRLAKNIKSGILPEIAQGAGVDLFGYSIGSFLALILMMGNPEGIFTKSRLFCFCGGMTIDRMFPVSRYIMDARAAVSMQKSFAQLLNSNFASDSRLGHYLNTELHPQESWFKTMLRYNHFQKEREQRFSELSKQITALVLEKDEVAPPAEALNTLRGGYRDIPVRVDIQDFAHSYTHITPFPNTKKDMEAIDISFTKVMRKAAEFLGGSNI